MRRVGLVKGKVRRADLQHGSRKLRDRTANFLRAGNGSFWEF